MADVDAENSLDILETEEPPAVLETMLSELAGRLIAAGEDGRGRPASLPFEKCGDEGCWRTANTNVLLIASLAHCGCIIYKSWR